MRSREESTDLPPIRILIVDDNEADVLLTRKALERAGVAHSADAVCNGIEALAYLRKEGMFTDRETPDIVLLDLNMPLMDGHATLAAMRDDEKLKSVPVLILTTSELPEDMAASFENQAQCFVTKPTSVAEFGDLIRAVMIPFTSATPLK